MGLENRIAIADRFAAYVGELTKVIGHADREGPLRDYCSGLLATEGRRSVEPMAAVTAPAQVSAQHQKLLHFVANAKWSDEQMLTKVRELAVPSMTRHGPIEAWIIDDTAFPKKGRHSVGVHHQYCGQLGNASRASAGQLPAVTLSIANDHASLPIAYRLYLPKEWIDDAPRRQKAHVPAAITFKTKPQIALEQIRAALPARVASGVVLMDAGYDAQRYSPLDKINSGKLKDLKLAYAVAIGGTAANENLEATPLAEDGFLYIVDQWGVV